MKKAWKFAKAMQEQSGFDPREEDCERSINGIQVCRPRQLSAIAGTPIPVAIRVRSSQCLGLVGELNEEYSRVWKLDVIWSCRPNNKPVTAFNTL